MAIIYTNNSSGAIRRLRSRKPTKAYIDALSKHIKFLRKQGFNVDDTGKIKFAKRETVHVEMPVHKTTNKIIESKPYHMGSGGTKPDNSWKIEESKKFTIVPAYNKGPYMVVSKSDLLTAGRKV
jgi:hypothetical protein